MKVTREVIQFLYQVYSQLKGVDIFCVQDEEENCWDEILNPLVKENKIDFSENDYYTLCTLDYEWVVDLWERSFPLVNFGDLRKDRDRNIEEMMNDCFLSNSIERLKIWTKVDGVDNIFFKWLNEDVWAIYNNWEERKGRFDKVIEDYNGCMQEEEVKLCMEKWDYNRMRDCLIIIDRIKKQFLSVYGDTLRELAAEEERSQSPVEVGSPVEEQEPEVLMGPSIPIELQSPTAKRIFGWMIEDGLISENYGWEDTLKRKRKLSYLCWRMSQVLKLGKNNRKGVQDISWKPFEELFKTTGLANSFNQLQRDSNYQVEGYYKDIDKYFS